MPPPKFFAYINPVQIHLDPLTLLWLNAFSLNLQQSVKLLSLEKTDAPYLDVKVEAIMFRVSLLSCLLHLQAMGKRTSEPLLYSWCLPAYKNQKNSNLFFFPLLVHLPIQIYITHE